MRAGVRNAAEALLVGSGATRLATRSRRGRTLILAYHNVVSPGEVVPGDRSLHLSLEDFRDQLDLLQATGTVVPLEALEGTPDRDAPPRFVLTFDDAYRGTVRLAVPELRARGLPATIFVPPGLLGTENFWWDSIPASGRDDPKPLGELRGEDARIREWARSQGLVGKEIPPMQRASSPEELAESLPDDLITLGCHTWDHPNLARLDPAEVEAQLTRTLEWLDASGLPWTRWITYPYGRTSDEVRRVARSLGFLGGLRVEGGWVPRHSIDPLDLPRLNIPAGLSIRGFRIRLAGLYPR